MKKKIDFYILAVKYWLRGDDWQDAKEYADFIIYSFKHGDIKC
jgi:hypothetical protein